jgi:hypothetical protein
MDELNAIPEDPRWAGKRVEPAWWWEDLSVPRPTRSGRTVVSYIDDHGVLVRVTP